MVGPLMEVLHVMHGTDGKQFFSVYVKIYIPRTFQGGGANVPPPVGAHEHYATTFIGLLVYFWHGILVTKYTMRKIILYGTLLKKLEQCLVKVQEF